MLKPIFQEIGLERGLYYLTQDRDVWRVFVNTVMILRVPYYAELSSQEGFSSMELVLQSVKNSNTEIHS
jgi:hypothetical protein